MDRRSRCRRLVTLLFVLGAFAVPAHLAFQDHDWDSAHHHEESDHSESSDQSHPATDHDSVTIAVSVKAQPVHLELALIAAVELSPAPQPEVSFIDVDVRDPSKVPKTSRAVSRAPPLL